MQRVLNFLSGAMLGGVVGAAIAILLAPTSGVELREQMQERAINSSWRSNRLPRHEGRS
jgi:gas vesicle protein